MDDQFNSGGNTKARLAGTLSGTDIHFCSLINANGMELTALSYGATLTSLKIPTHNGAIDIVLGFDELQDYIDSYGIEVPPYFGATVGRFAGRIENGRFSIDGFPIQLNQNNGVNALHGGNIGFCRKVWKVEKLVDGPAPAVTFALTSPDGDEHYPGELHVSVTYTLSENNDFIIDYMATTSKPTIINLTHHSYFNLNGHADDLSGQQVFVNADQMLETRDDMIPTGKRIALANHLFDFSVPKPCPRSIDASFVIKDRNGPAAELFSPKTGIRMSVSTDQPSVHLYVGGNCFGKVKGKSNADYHKYSGMCFETQRFPDAPHHPDFPDCRLNPGNEYQHKTTYHFETESL